MNLALYFEGHCSIIFLPTLGVTVHCYCCIFWEPQCLFIDVHFGGKQKLMNLKLIVGTKISDTCVGVSVTFKKSYQPRGNIV